MGCINDQNKPKNDPRYRPTISRFTSPFSSSRWLHKLSTIAAGEVLNAFISIHFASCGGSIMPLAAKGGYSLMQWCKSQSSIAMQHMPKLPVLRLLRIVAHSNDVVMKWLLTLMELINAQRILFSNVSPNGNFRAYRANMFLFPISRAVASLRKREKIGNACRILVFIHRRRNTCPDLRNLAAGSHFHPRTIHRYLCLRSQPNSHL